jgi:hypothetical protein
MSYLMLRSRSHDPYGLVSSAERPLTFDLTNPAQFHQFYSVLIP